MSFHRAHDCSVTWPHQKRSLPGGTLLACKPSASASPRSNQYSIYRHPCHTHIVCCLKRFRFELPGSVSTKLLPLEKNYHVTDLASTRNHLEPPSHLYTVSLLFYLHYLLLLLQQNQIHCY